MVNDWNANYEKITDMIVPRSSQMITQDNDYALCTVTLFKKVVDEFKLHARERKFVVREFTYNEEELAAGKNEITKLVTDKKKQFVSGCWWLGSFFNASDEFFSNRAPSSDGWRSTLVNASVHGSTWKLFVCS